MSKENEADTEAGKEKKGSLLAKLKIAGIVVLVLLIAIVIFQNSESVETKILLVKLTMPRAVLLLLTFLLGAAVGILVAYLRPWRKKR